ncbi:MAG: CxxxxCH/CxxCH domain-containing protein [Anaeromyxobacter sp.]|nr:CxxxxCH/CxxCH domain-containing protein [Anaeromyxobacter sp.]
MRANRLVFLALLAGAAALSGCDKARQAQGPEGGVITSCTGCHGGVDNTTGAPPRDVAGNTLTSVVTVGAHSTHLAAGVDCAACHAVPSRVDSAGHIDGGATPKVKFSGAAVLGGATPTWNRTGAGGQGTCSNVYCHGATLAAGGQATQPTWSGSPLTMPGAPCGSCHGTAATNGAPAGHASTLDRTDCNNCHAGTVLPDGTIKPRAEGGLHVDGEVQSVAGSCTSCHGDDTRAETDLGVQAAPPVDSNGEVTGAKVGAHLRHLSGVAGLGSRLSRPLKCAECHLVPTTVPHNATSVVQFATAAGTLAKGPGGALAPTYAPATGTCSSVYCHGAGLLGGSAKNPAWTTTFASAAAQCGTCHFAANPPAPHPTRDNSNVLITTTTQCIQCHPGTVLATGEINVSNGLHVNGVKDIDFHAPGYAAGAVHGGPAKLDLAGCRACHGADLEGGSVGISCNACHAASGASTWQTNCALCHGEPNRAEDTAHDLVGTPPMRANKASPPVGSQDELTPAANAVGAHLAHIQVGALANAFKCQQCHGAAMPADIAHVNGLVSIGWQLAATGGSTPSPTAGSITRATPVSCTNYCHGATLGGGTKKAANGTPIAVTWTGGAAEATCGTCHALPPAYAAPSWHPNDTACGTCHYAGIDKARHVNGLVDLAAGVGCATCHGSATNFAPPRAASNGATASTDPRVGAHQAHLVAGPLAGAFACSACHGPTLPISNGHADGRVTVGWSALATTGGVAATPAAGTYAPGGTATCANYCHGGKWAATASTAGTLLTPGWTGGPSQAACGTCHKVAPTTGSHTTVNAAGSTVNCSSCHAGYSCLASNPAACTVNVTAHVNGTVDTSGQTCSTCHGTAGRTLAAGTLGPVNNANNLIAVPPLDTQGAATGVRVGPHQAHVNPAAAGGQSYKVVQCSECHTTAVNSYAVTHPNGATLVSFANATGANLGGFTPTLAAGTPPVADTCATYCHGATLSAAQRGSITSWSWNTGITTTCGSCHGAAPGDPVHTSVSKTAAASACNPCHSTVVSAAGAILFTGSGAAATTAHINGVIDVAGATCFSCHGLAANGNFAPPLATNGNTLTTQPKVGAHQKHLSASSLRTGTAAVCTDCHSLPSTLDHATGAADVTWSAFARTGGLTATPATINAAWEASPTCTNYCHGGKWATTPAVAGTDLSPSWTAGAPAAACGTCHQVAPTGTHPTVAAATSCVGCHAGYACTPGNLAACTVNLTTHINGTVEFTGGAAGCGGCHGTAGRTYAAGTLGPQDTADHIQGAPPRDVSQAASSPQVGPHQAHVNPASQGAQIYRATLCSECHTVAVNAFPATGHAALSPKVNFADALGADLGGVVPTYTPAANATLPDTCATYCHGASFTAAQRGSITTWQWNVGITADCGSCHASPPADQFHTRLAKPSAATTCSACHLSVVSAAGAITFTGSGAAATTLHLDGLNQASSATCTSCHGTAAAGNAAPPASTTGAATGVEVGAHQPHLTGTTQRTAAITCADCHTVPGTMDHANGTTTVTWGALATTGGLAPTPTTINATWEATPTCTNYCHGQKWAADAVYRGSVTAPSWTGGAAQQACGTCHRVAPNNTNHTAANAGTQNCSACHTGYACLVTNLAACTVNKTTHINGTGEATGGSCIVCHATTAGARRPIVPEFALAWSHKRSATGAVTNFDCAVCHMEGDPATGDAVSGVHQDGVINLRDPDTGANIKGVTFTAATATTPGSYAPTATDVAFARFSRNLASNVLEPAVQAMMVNQCLKCHDANGANSPLARVPSGTAQKPFNTTISGAAYTGAGMTAGGILGGVVDVAASFATTNASYHPILGQQNNSFVGNLRMQPPWNTRSPAKTPGTIGTVASYGFLISCWDCHAPLGTTSATTLTATVTAHGGATTLRQAGWTVNATNICTVCHLVVPLVGATTNSHGVGSAFSGGGNSGPGGIARTSCWRCHGSLNTGKPARPISAQDVHGFNAMSPSLGTDTLWPVGGTNTYRPFGFMRSAGSGGMWVTTSWKPLSGPSVPAGTATCGGTAALGAGCSNNDHLGYTPGGVY